LTWVSRVEVLIMTRLLPEHLKGNPRATQKQLDSIS